MPYKKVVDLTFIKRKRLFIWIKLCEYVTLQDAGYFYDQIQMIKDEIPIILG